MTQAWPTVELGHVLSRSNEALAIVPSERYKEVTVRLWGKGAVLRGEVQGQEIAGGRRFCVRAGQFILSRIDARNGASGIVPGTLDGAVVSNDFPAYNVVPSRLFTPYLGWLSRTRQFVDLCRAASEGTTNRVRLQEERFLRMAIPLPPVPEQQRIVAKVEEVTAKIEEARALRQRVDGQCDALCRSILLADPGPPTPMRDIVTLRDEDTPVVATDTYHFAGVYCFGRGVFPGEQKSGPDFAYKSLTRLQAGDFVYPKLMAWEGALGIVPPECDGLYVSPEYPVFDVSTERVLPETLDVYFRSPSVWPQLAEISTGTNVRRRRLHPKNFLGYRMPLPSMETQQRLRAVKAKVDSLKALQAQTAAELDALLPSVLDKAFKGEL
jgi:type I restriction enzyme S subunit